MTLGFTSGRLLDRDGELAAIGHAVAQAREGAGNLLVIDGPAGVGKTALVEAASAAAADAGLRVLSARGAELEQDFAFGVMRQLFDHVVRTLPPAVPFAGAARFAAPLLEVELDGVPPAPLEDPFAARHALYWLTANLAAEQPVALVIDDGHWADAASLAALGHIAHRLEGIGVALVVATRREESHPALDAIRREAGERGTLLHLDPLGTEATAAVVRTFAPAADDDVCRACHAATGGNPFLLHELARSVAGEGGAIDAARVAEQSPERVTREIAARLARLPDAAGRLAGAAAILGGGVALREAAALAELRDDEAAAAADALVAAGVLRDTHPVEFLHPLVLAAVYAGLGPARRAHDHARAARLLADEAASPERVAAQLLRCRPADDRWAYERLVAAARLAAAHGAGQAAATYLRRALDEPAPAEDRAALLFELGAAESQSDPFTAVVRLREALAGDLDDESRFRAAMMLAALLAQLGRVPEAADVLEEQFEAFSDRPDVRGTMEAALANVTRIDPATRHRAAGAIERMRRRVESGAERDPSVLGTIAAEMGMAGVPIDEMAPVAERAVTSGHGTVASAQGWSWYNGVRSLVVSERYDTARWHLDDALAATRARGAVLDAGSALTFRSELHLHVGDLRNAEIDARTLHEISELCGWTLAEGFALAWLGEVLIERGELDEAERVLTQPPFDGPATALQPIYPSIWLLLARGRLRVAQGRPDVGAEELRVCGERALSIGQVSPTIVPWRSELAYALMALGETAEAHALVTEELDLARACGATRAIGIALRAAAQIAGGDDELRLLREAVDVLKGTAAQLECARVHADLGAALHRAGAVEDARESLRAAVELAHRCGAVALEDSALAELRATGARPRRRVTTGADALTPSERRIAELAATGQQNREIAEALFVTTPTVEFHLRNAYRKLGIASRTQLAAALEMTPAA